MPGTVRKSYGAHFAARRVAGNYRFRPDYSPEIYDTLLSLVVRDCPVVLDAGCGPGKLALGLADRVARVDAVDPSKEMLEVARSSGSNPKIRWICARIEEAALEPPYGLVVAGASFHWMDKEIALDRFARALAPGGLLALVDGDAPVGSPWEAVENALFADFIERLQGAPPQFPPSRLEGLARPMLEHPRFRRLGGTITEPWDVTQSIDDYLRCQHSRATWSEDFMGPALSEEFDARMRAMLSRHTRAGMLDYEVRSRMEWGKPLIEADNPAP